MRVTIPLPEYLPDQSLNSGVLLEADGVIPAADGYEPLKGFLEISEPLPATFLGGFSAIAQDGTSYLLAGTANGLARYGAGTWTDLRVGLSVDTQWRFETFGNVAIGVNGSNTQVVDLVAGTASDLAGAPAGKSIALVRDYVVIGQAENDLLGIYTSEVNDHTKWNVATTGATYQPMLAGGEVMGLAGGEYGVILQRRRLMRMTPTGDDTAPFAYDQITDNFGCASRGSVAVYGRSVFFLSDSGFVACEDGQQVRPIGTEKVDETFKKLVRPDDYENIFAAVDPKRKLVIWAVLGNPGSLWIYNFELGKWSTATMPIEGVFAGFTSSSTLEDVAVTYPDLDAMPYSLDDPRFSGGSPQFYAVQGGRIGSLSGDNVKAVFQMGFGDFARGTLARFRQVRPITDCIDDMNVKLDVRFRLGDSENMRVAGPLRDSGAMPIRATGRFVKPRWEIPEGAVWSYAQALEFDYEPAGIR